VTSQLFAPLSIPSPNPSWQSFSIPVGEWFTWLGMSPDVALTIHAYALCILAGIVAAVLMTSARFTRRGGEPGIVLDIALWAVVFGIAGARFYHVITHPTDYFGEGKDPLAVFYIWEGGLAIFGALTFGALGIYFGCRIAGIRFMSFADALIPGLLLAQAFGRLGNYFNNELFGQPTDLPWGLEISADNGAWPLGLPAGTLFHPTFLYEILWNLLGVVVLLLIERRLNLRWGKLLGVYLIWYGVGRTWFETIRIDPSEAIFGVRVNVWAALAAIVIGVIILVVQNRRHPGMEPSVYRPGKEWSPAATGVDSEDTYSNADDTGNDATQTLEKPATSGSGSSR
jgi:prolipoprotein diacylglyceryl transferase